MEKQIIIQPHIKIIESDAFCECAPLTQVSIPSSVTEIGKYAFSKCSSLIQVSIPSIVTTIEPTSFSGCLRLHEIPTRQKNKSSPVAGAYALKPNDLKSKIFVNSILNIKHSTLLGKTN